MKRPHFHWCNHGCRVRKARGMATNGSCRFPNNLYMLRVQTNLITNYYHDDEIRKYARKIEGLLSHIYESEE